MINLSELLGHPETSFRDDSMIYMEVYTGVCCFMLVEGILLGYGKYKQKLKRGPIEKYRMFPGRQ